MALSGSYDFAITRDNIINAALRKLNVVDQFEDATAKEISQGSEALNLVAKRWQAQGLHLWKYEEVIVLLERNKTLYTLAPTGDNAALENDLAETTLSADAASGVSTITVTSATGMAASDTIFIQLSDGTSQTTTISSISTNTITLGAVLTGAASSGDKVFAYTSKIQKPMRVTDARRRNTDGNDIPVEVIPRKTYFDLSTKSDEGKVTQIYYNPKISSGNLRVWQPTDNVGETLRLTVEYPMQDFDSTTDNPDFPIEWGDALIFNLAVVLAPEYGVFGGELAELKALAREYKEELLDYDQEDTYIQFTPNLTGEYY